MRNVNHDAVITRRQYRSLSCCRRSPASSGQRVRAQIAEPAYQTGRGPRVVIDAAHLNFHTEDGGYAPFAKLLRLDGYRVESNREPFTAASLGRADVLVIANAMHKQSEADWAPLPTYSAFTDPEIAAVEVWVRQGGSLLLIADHMPLAGHAQGLAAAFGVRFQNGFALDSAGSGQITYRRSDGSLPSGPIANGRKASERVDSVTTYTGQAFRLDPALRAEPVLVLRDGYQLLLPRSPSSSLSGRPGSRRQTFSREPSCITVRGESRCSARRRCSARKWLDLINVRSG